MSNILSEVHPELVAEWSDTTSFCVTVPSVTAGKLECVFLLPLPHTPTPKLPDYPKE